MKHHCFINLKTYIERQYFGLGIQIVSLMYNVHRNFWRYVQYMAIQSWEYHIVPRLRQ